MFNNLKVKKKVIGRLWNCTDRSTVLIAVFSMFQLKEGE